MNEAKEIEVRAQLERATLQVATVRKAMRKLREKLDSAEDALELAEAAEKTLLARLAAMRVMR